MSGEEIACQCYGKEYDVGNPESVNPSQPGQIEHGPCDNDAGRGSKNETALPVDDVVVEIKVTSIQSVQFFLYPLKYFHTGRLLVQLRMILQLFNERSFSFRKNTYNLSVEQFFQYFFYFTFCGFSVF